MIARLPGAFFAALIITYTVLVAVRSWREGNRRGGIGLLLFTAAVTGLTVFLLIRPLPLP